MAALRNSSIAFMALLTGACAAPEEASLPSAEMIDAEARRLMAKEDVKGLALAVIDEGKVVHLAAYGARNVEQALPLETDTIMYGASLTKAAFAYMVLQLSEEGLIDLDASIASYLPKPLPDYKDYADLAGDERWRALTPRIILNHATGFANFRWLEEDEKLRFHFEPGSRYAYSGEGFYILQDVIEQGLGLDAGAEMQRRIFDRFDMSNTSMMWREDFASNLADGYAMDGSYEPHDERSRVSAAGSMDTTIADQAKMWAGIVRGDGMSAKARAEYARPQLAITSAHQFPTLLGDTDSRGAEIGLSAGLGVIVFEGADGPTFFKGGHNDWTGNMAICEERRKRCLVMLANSVRAELVYPALATFVLGETKMPWWWEYNPE